MAAKRATGFLKRFLALLGLLGVLCLALAWQWRDFDWKSKLPQAPKRIPLTTEAGPQLERLNEERLKVARSKAQEIKQLRRERSEAVVYPVLGVPVVKNASTRRKSRDNYLQFRLQELDAYQRLTKDSPEAKAAGVKFIDNYLRQLVYREYNDEDYEQLNELGQAAIKAGSKDPLLRTFQRMVQWQMTQDHDDAEQAWLQILQELPKTKYPKTIEIYARYFLRDVDRARKSFGHDRRTPHPLPVAALVQWLQEYGTDSKWRESICERLWILWDMANMVEREQLLVAILAAEGIDDYITHLLAGHYYIQLAWQHRGGGYANTVTADRWKQFEMHAVCAADHLEYAWYLHPELPYAPCHLITLAMAGKGTGERPHFWFQRTLEANFDYYRAYLTMEQVLLPRWSGSHEDMLSFARNCVGTGRFDTVVPYIAVELLKELRDVEEEDLSTHRLAAQLLREFASKRDAYRKASPDVRLYEDNGSYRADLVLLMEQCHLPDLAAAELRAAGNNLNWIRLRYQRRPGRYLATRVIASQSAPGKRVLPFDEKLRQPWDASTDPSLLKWLTDEYQELRGLTPEGDPAEAYLSHAGAILKQLQQFSAGDWAPLQIDEDLTGWEPYAYRWWYHDAGVNLTASGEQGGHVNLRPLANFQPPLEMEATFEVLDPQPWVDKVGIGWSREGTDEELYPMQLTVPKFAIESSIYHMDGQPARRDFVQNQGLTSFIERYPLKTTGPHRLRLKLWNESAEFSVDDTIWSTTQLSQPWDRAGYLCLGTNLTAPNGGTLRLSDIRIRKLDIPPPPAESESLDVRSKYWEERLTTGPADDSVTLGRLCRIRYEQKRLEDVLSFAQLLQEKHPGINNISVWKARALIKHRHDEAGALAELKAAEDYQTHDDLEVLSGLAEVLSMAQDATLRNGQQALGLARLAITVSGSKHARSLAAQAAAEAEQGDCRAAINSLNNALQMASESEKAEWEPRMASYRLGQPYRFPSADKSSSQPTKPD